MAKTNFKQLLMDKGEKIGVAVAAGIAGLLVLTQLFWPGYGLFAPSPREHEKTLKTLSAQVTARMSNPNTEPGPTDLPDEKKAKATPEGFAQLRIENAGQYGVGDLFAVTTPADSNRREPRLFQPGEGRAVPITAQVRTYILNPQMTEIGMLKGASGAPGAGGPGVAGQTGTSNGKNDLDRAKGFYNPRSGGGNRPPGGGAPPPGGPGGRGGMNGRGNLQKPDEGTEGAEFKMIAIDQMDAQKDMRLAESICPLRMAELVASFPYKAQLDEFRSKLRLGSRAAVLAETSQELDATGKEYLPAFRFLTVKAQRMEVDAEGKPKRGKTWVDLKLGEDYKPYVIHSGRRLEPEDATLESISFDRLVMPRLLQIRENQYPAIEKTLPTLAASLEEVKEKKVTSAPPSFLNGDDFDPFNRGGAGMDRPGQGPPGMGPGVGPGVGPGPKTGGPPPGGSGQLPGPGGKLPNGGQPGQLGQEVQPPDHCLIRLLDVTVQPGKAYKYRIQVHMANPNYKRTDVANPTYAEEKELATNNQWFELPDVVVVPPELHYYAVDQKELDGKDYKGINADTRLLPNQVAIQIQKWLENAAEPKNPPRPVGEWVVAERLIVGRGEYVGREQRIEVPIWVPRKEAFVITATKQGRKEIYGVKVSFSTGQLDTILVDFSGGTIHHDATEMKGDKPVKTTVKDHQRTEVLLCSPDGKLLALDSPEDTDNAERTSRLKAYRDRIKELKPKTAGGGVFGGP